MTPLRYTYTSCVDVSDSVTHKAQVIKLDPLSRLGHEMRDAAVRARKVRYYGLHRKGLLKLG